MRVRVKLTPEPHKLKQVGKYHHPQPILDFAGWTGVDQHRPHKPIDKRRTTFSLLPFLDKIKKEVRYPFKKYNIKKSRTYEI